MKPFIKLSGAVVLMLTLGFSGVAGAQGEKAVLARLVHELSAMEYLVATAQRAPKSPGSRLNFDYGALRNDLEKVRNGLREYINMSAITPRTTPIIQPLNGAYTN